MIKQTWEKIKGVGRWVKRQWKKIAVAVVGGMVVYAAILSPVPTITAPENNTFKIGVQNFQTAFAQDVTEDRALQYQLDDKFISFKPTAVYFDGRKVLNANKVHRVLDKYENVFSVGTDLEVQISSRIFKKLITIHSDEALGLIPNGTEFIDIEFEIETNFIIDGWDKKSDYEVTEKIRIGDFSYFEPAMAWDSWSSTTCEIINEEEICEYLNNKIQIKSWFSQKGQKLYYTKQLPVDWLRVAQFPVYTDADITYGTLLEFDSGEPREISVTQLDTDKFIICYADYGSSSDGVCVIGTVSGSTLSYGTQSVFNTDTIEGASPYKGHVDVALIDTNKVAVAYMADGLDDDGFTRVATFSGSTIGTWGTETEFDNSDVEFISVASLGTDKYVICYNDETASNTGQCVAITVSGTTPTIGTPVDFAATDYYPKWNSTVYLEADKFANCYLAEDNDYTYCVAGTVSGTTITMGTEKQVNRSSQYGSYSVGADSYETDKVILCDPDSGTTDGKVIPLTLSGTTFTEGTNTSFDTSPVSCKIAMIDATHFVIAFHNNYFYNTANTIGESNYGSVDFTTRIATPGTSETFEADNITNFDITHIGGGKVVMCYMNYADGRDGECIVGEVAGAPPADTCTCPETPANWNVDSDDNCWLLADCDIGTNNLNLYWKGSGAFNIGANAALSLRAINSTSTPINVCSGCQINFK